MNWNIKNIESSQSCDQLNVGGEVQVFNLWKWIYAGVIHWDREHIKRSKYKMSFIFTYVKF